MAAVKVAVAVAVAMPMASLPGAVAQPQLVKSSTGESPTGTSAD